MQGWWVRWIISRARYDTRAHEKIDVDDVAEAYIRFKNGTIGCLYATCNYSYDAPIFLELHGEKGLTSSAIRPSLPGNKTMTVEQQADETSGLRYGSYSHKRQIQDHYRAILEGRKPKISGQEGKTAVDMVLAMYESSRRRVPISIPICTRCTFVPGAQRMLLQRLMG